MVRMIAGITKNRFWVPAFPPHYSFNPLFFCNNPSYDYAYMVQTAKFSKIRKNIGTAKHKYSDVYNAVTVRVLGILGILSPTIFLFLFREEDKTH